MAKRVTYLIGAGASANALPVVNGLSERIRVFYNYLCYKKEYNSHTSSFFTNYDVFYHIEKLIGEIEDHYTIDTLAKKYYLTFGDNDNYKFLKILFVCYLYFEQIQNKNKETIEECVKKWVSTTQKIQEYKNENKSYFDSKEYIELVKSLNKIIDYRYDSFLAALLNKSGDKLILPSNINIISWNYDAQFELAYSNYVNSKNMEDIGDYLQVYPSPFVGKELDLKKSAIIKLNGTATFKNSYIFNDIDLPRSDFSNERILQNFRSINDLWEKKELHGTNLKFAWENDEQVAEARNYAKEIIGNSDVIVIIGYSFPTFNREIDRKIFDIFNKSCVKITSTGEKIILRKIYIQDLHSNASKIRERLKAVGNYLFHVAEIYDEVDQFLIPPEL